MLDNHFIMFAKSLIPSCLALTLGLFQVANAQLKVDIGKPEITAMNSPEFPNVGGARRAFRPKEWFEASIELEVKKKVDRNEIPFVEELGVDWYVAIQNPGGSGTLLLEKQTDYINIPYNEEVMVSAYLSPTSVKLLTGKDRVLKADFKYIAAVFTIDGEEVGVASNYSVDKWWESPNLSNETSVELLSKDQTPFRLHWWDLYAEAKSN